MNAKDTIAPGCGQAVFSWLRGPSRSPFTRSRSPRMAFNLKKVLKALLYSSSQPLATKDIQAAFERSIDR